MKSCCVHEELVSLRNNKPVWLPWRAEAQHDAAWSGGKAGVCDSKSDGHTAEAVSRGRTCSTLQRDLGGESLVQLQGRGRMGSAHSDHHRGAMRQDSSTIWTEAVVTGTGGRLWGSGKAKGKHSHIGSSPGDGAPLPRHRFLLLHPMHQPRPVQTLSPLTRAVLS